MKPYHPIASLLILDLLLSPALAGAACKLDKLVDLQVTMVGGYATVPAKVGASPETFILASASAYSTLSPASVARLNPGLKASAHEVGSTDSAGRAASLQVVTVNDLTLGRMPYTGVDFIVGGTQIVGAAGVLGQNVLQIGDVDYDLAHGQVTVLRPEGCASTSLAYWATSQPYSVVDLQPAPNAATPSRITAYLNGQPVNVVLDTASPVSMVSSDAAQRLGIKPLPGPGDRAGVSVGAFQSFRIGDEEIKNVRLRMGEAKGGGPDLVLGSDFLRSHHVFVAASQRKVYFTYGGGQVFDLDAAGATTGASPSGNSQEPADAAGYARRGSAYAAAHDYPSAISDLTRATELAPSQADYFYELALARLANGDVNQAALDFDQSITLRPDYVPALLARAGLRLRNNQLAQAAADVDAADAAAPKDSSERRAMAQIYERTMQVPKAIVQNDLWIAAHPNDAALADALRARCAERAVLREHLDKALEDCDAAVRLGGGSAWSLEWRAVVHFQRGEYEPARADFDAALRLDPKRALLQYGRGAARVRLKQVNPGRADIDAAVKREPPVADEARQLGVVP